MASPRYLDVLGLGLVAVHLVWSTSHVEPAISGPDAGGYFLQARQLATAGHTWQALESPLQYVAPHWIEGEGGRYYSKYPPGFPLLLAAFDAAFGVGAALYVDPLLTALSLLALFLICRRWLGSGWAAAAVGMMVANPVVNQHVLGGFAHMAVASLLLWAVYALERWRQSHAWGWALAAGLCIGAIPGARYAEVLFGGGLAVALVHHAWTRRPHPRCWGSGPAAFAAGAATPILALAFRNQAAFGAFWRTGYAASQEQTGFAWRYFAEHWPGYLTGLVEGLGPLFGLAVAGLTTMLAKRGTRAHGGLILGLILPTSLLYSAYYWHSDGMSQRFLLPTYFLYAIAATHLLRTLATGSGLAGRSAAWTVLALTLLWGLPQARREVARQSSERALLAEVSDFVADHVEDGAVLFVDRAMAQQLDYLGRWRLAAAGALVADAGPRRRRFGSPGPDSRPQPLAGRPLAAERYRHLTGADLRHAVAADADAWTQTAGTDLFFLVGPRRQQVLERRLDSPGSLREVARLELPAPPPARRGRRAAPGDRRMPGGFGGGPAGVPGPPGFAGRGAVPGRRPGGGMFGPPSGTLLLLVWER